MENGIEVARSASSPGGTYPALQFASQERPLIEVYTRNDDETWTLAEARPPGEVSIDALECRLSLAEIYAGVFGEG